MTTELKPCDGQYIDAVLRELNEDRLTVASIARKIGCTGGSIKRIAHHYGIDLHTRNNRCVAARDKRYFDDAYLEQFHDDLLRGWTQLDLQKKYSISRHTLQQVIQRLGYADFNEVRAHIGMTVWKGRKNECLTHIPESLSKDGTSLKWLSKAW